ncbi:RimK family alpha-L-glutamate ligase [candidate division KSB1 bacterium]
MITVGRCRKVLKRLLPKEKQNDIDFLLEKSGVDIYKLFREYNSSVVLKPVSGNSGINMYYVNDIEKLKSKAQKLLERYSNFCVSPFYNIDIEYRVIILNNEILYVHKKELPCLTGDGKSTILDLCKEHFSEYKSHRFNTMIEDITEFDKYPVSFVPEKNQKVRPFWKHNSCKGGSIDEITDSTIIDEVSQLALRASKIVQTNFASYDIAHTDDGYKIIEVNGMVSLDPFKDHLEDGENIAKSIYRKAILSKFHIEN